MTNEAAKSLNEYTADELRQLAKQREQGPFLDDLNQLVELATSIGQKHGRTAKSVLNASIARLPKSR